MKYYNGTRTHLSLEKDAPISREAGDRLCTRESLLPENGERPFAVLTRKVIKAEMKARTPSQASNLLSALRGMIRWMIDEEHLEEDDDPTIGLKSGKAKASRESGRFVPWTEEDMTLYRAKWPLGTEARLMFESCTTHSCGLATRIASDNPICARSFARSWCRSKPRKAEATPLLRCRCIRSFRKACGRRAQPGSSARRSLPARS
jgi:hypothetical protein